MDPQRPAPRAPRPRGTPWHLWILSGAVLLLLAGAGIWFFGRRSLPPEICPTCSKDVFLMMEQGKSEPHSSYVACSCASDPGLHGRRRMPCAWWGKPDDPNWYCASCARTWTHHVIGCPRWTGSAPERWFRRLTER